MINSGTAIICLWRVRWCGACWVRLMICAVLVLAMLPITVRFAHCAPPDAAGEGNFPAESREEEEPETPSITGALQRRARRHLAAISLHAPLHVARPGAEVSADASSSVGVSPPAVRTLSAAGSFPLRC